MKIRSLRHTHRKNYNSCELFKGYKKKHFNYFILIFVIIFSSLMQSYFFFEANVLITQTLHPLKVVLPVIDKNFLTLPYTLVSHNQQPGCLVFDDLPAVFRAAVVYEPGFPPPSTVMLDMVVKNLLEIFRFLLRPVFKLVVGYQLTCVLACHAACEYLKLVIMPSCFSTKLIFIFKLILSFDHIYNR